MIDALSQFWQQLAERPSGPLAMRFYLQPLMATFLAVRDGMKDARSQKPPYFWSVFTDREHRGQLLWDGWKSIGKVATIALLLDFVYQIIALRRIRVLEAVVVATTLALIPYVALRGPVNRIARTRRRPNLPS